jgi:hypothetical protein
LAARESLFGTEIDKIIVVHPDFEGFGMSFKIVVEGFKGADNGEEFFIMDIIILFSWEE